MSDIAKTKRQLYLVPNTLDFGVDFGGQPPDLQTVLPLQAIRIASQLGHWVAENAKTTRAFLKRVDAVMPLRQPLQSLHIVELPRAQKGEKPSPQTVDTAPMDALLAPALQGFDVGLISEAGLPAVADPGAALVAAAHRLGIVVVPLSGPSSLMMALSTSGLNGQSFAFVGYLPVDAAARTIRVRELEALSKRSQQTQMMIETPYRNQALLNALLLSLSPACHLSVSCGLTLPNGWNRCDRVSQWKLKPSSLPNDVPAVFALLAD
jgi:16S rRNA (cytidine1402-2'-O)-methyltransferase